MRYVLHPGFVTSEADGDNHFISGPRLAKLYGVDIRECVYGNRADYFLKKGDIHLRPRQDGNYALPPPNRTDAQPAAGEPVATILAPDGADERGAGGFHVSLEDLQKLSRLPAGTKLYTGPRPAQAAQEIDGGKVWSFLRSVMSQGADIYQDYLAGRHTNYEAYAVRLDTAVSERMRAFRALFTSAAHPVPEGWTSRQRKVLAFALRRFANEARIRMNAAAQDKRGIHFKPGDDLKFLADAKDAEEILAMFAAAPSPHTKPFANNRVEQNQQTHHPADNLNHELDLGREGKDLGDAVDQQRHDGDKDQGYDKSTHHDDSPIGRPLLHYRDEWDMTRGDMQDAAETMRQERFHQLNWPKDET